MTYKKYAAIMTEAGKTPQPESEYVADRIGYAYSQIVAAAKFFIKTERMSAADVIRQFGFDSIPFAEPKDFAWVLMAIEKKFVKQFGGNGADGSVKVKTNVLNARKLDTRRDDFKKANNPVALDFWADTDWTDEKLWAGCWAGQIRMGGIDGAKKSIAAMFGYLLTPSPEVSAETIEARRNAMNAGYKIAKSGIPANTNIKLSEIIAANEFAKNFFTDSLYAGDATGLNILYQRGIDDGDIEKWGIGLAPAQRSVLVEKSKSIYLPTGHIVAAGLTKDGTNDFFRGRLIFPIFSEAGDVVAFSGRVIGEVPNAPKYINSPETAAYKKGQTLYGLNHAKGEIKTKDFCIFTEGYTDVISMHKAGIGNTVASCGTSLTVEQVRMVRALTNNALLLFDGDAAGVKAAMRAIEIMLENGMEVKILQLPTGDDPDTFARREGLEGFERYRAENEMGFLQFQKAQIPGAASVAVTVSAFHAAVESLAAIPNEGRRIEEAIKCASVFGYSPEATRAELQKAVEKRSTKRY